MLASIGIALTPTILCAMVGMVVLAALDQSPELARRKRTRSLLLCILIVSFTVLCFILLKIRPGRPAMGLLAISALAFMTPAYLRLRNPDKYRKDDRSPWLWRLRTHIPHRSASNYLSRLEKLEQKLKLRPLDPILNLQALELALRCNENNRALFHCHVLDEVLSSGSAHEHVLRNQIFILSHRQRRHEDAENVIQRLEKLYPVEYRHDEPPRREGSSTSSGENESGQSL